ncbi:hypothetical protein GJAV_G00120490 [Gymnothorax javanicus]|nr:hypothetical protein GJAV_G00120490 [Gymnothorax javanicus]
MTGLFLILLISFVHVKRITSCPASCVVCSEDAVICHKLSSIIEVPETTKVLMLTDGQIDFVDGGNFSDLSNMTMLGLSNNGIANITGMFQNLGGLKVLLLDHNLIASSSIFASTFDHLRSLEILQLGHNAIGFIRGGWFRHTRTLLTLQLEGNLIASLESATFRAANLENLETLDLSDNLIEHIDGDSFRALPRLRRLDLSGNNLRTAPDAFSYLAWLSALNLDHNQWNCTCELQELSAFLSSYMQAPDKVLYNGRQLVCLSAANPAVQTVLQLTEANCVPPNENITVVVSTKGGISARQYARDVALAAAFFFVGGVALTLSVLYILYFKLELRKFWNFWRDRNWDDEGGAGVQSQGLPEWSFSGDNKTQILSITHPAQETKLMSSNSAALQNHRPWIRDGLLSSLGTGAPNRHFVCRHCSADSGDQGQYQRRNGGQNSFSRQEDGPHHFERFSDEKQRLNHIYHSPPSHRCGPSPYSTVHRETQANGACRGLGGGHFLPNSHAQATPTLPDYLTIQCSGCLKTHEYRPAGSSVRTARIPTLNEGTLETQYGGLGLSEPNTWPCRERDLNGEESRGGLDSHRRRVWNPGVNEPLQRMVTFNLTGPDALAIADSEKKLLKTQKLRNSDVQKQFREKPERGDQSKRHKLRVQSNGLLKVKLNLNPFRKHRVHAKEHLSQEDLPSAIGKVAKKSKQSSRDKNIHLMNSKDSHDAPETKRKSSKVSKKLSQSASAKQSHDVSKQRVKSARPNISRKVDKVKNTERGSHDLEAVDQEISESRTKKKQAPKIRQKVEDDASGYQESLGKSGEEKSPSLSRSSRRNKSSPGSDGDSQGSSAHLEEKGQPKSVKVAHQKSGKEDSTDGTRTAEINAEEGSRSGDVSVSREMSSQQVLNEEKPSNLELKEGEEPSLVQGGTSLMTEKTDPSGTSEELIRPSPNSSLVQNQASFPDASPTQEGQGAHSLDLADALMEQTPQPHTGLSSTEFVREEAQSFVQNQPGHQDERYISEMEGLKPLSRQGSTNMPSREESDGKLTDSLSVGAGPTVPQSHSTELLADLGVTGTSLVDSMSAPDSQPIPRNSDETSVGGPGPTNPLNAENLSNNNSMKRNSSNPMIFEEYLPPSDGCPKRKIRLILPERPRSRQITPLDKKIR